MLCKEKIIRYYLILEEKDAIEYEIDNEYITKVGELKFVIPMKASIIGEEYHSSRVNIILYIKECYGSYEVSQR